MSDSSSATTANGRGKAKIAGRTSKDGDGAIRDLGYSRYDGPRLPPRRRYAVLAKQHINLAWKQGLVKAVMILGVSPVLVCGVVMYFKLQAAKLAAKMGAASFTLGAPPEAWIHNCIYWSQLWFAFALSLLVAAPAISDDVRTGAFQFYFARPLTRSHYVLSKLLAVGGLTLILCAAPSILLVIMRLSLARDSADAMASLPLLASVPAFALLYGATLTLPAMALSSLTKNTGYVMGGWASIFFLPWPLGEATASMADMPYVALISLPTDLRLIAQHLFHVKPSYDVPVLAPLGVLLGVCALSVIVLWRRLEKLEVFA